MRVGILGSGEVGRVLGKGFADGGHEVKLGTRYPTDAKIVTWLADSGDRASVGSFAEAATFGDIAVLATKWDGTENAIRLAGPANLVGKLVFDPTNPLDFAAMPPTLSLGHTTSGGEQVQKWLPGAHVVKAFNHVGSSHMVRPNFPGGPPDMFICGNDAGAKEHATRILRDFGWSVIDLGGIESSRYLEPLAMVWILRYFQIRSGNHAFKLLRK